KKNSKRFLHWHQQNSGLSSNSVLSFDEDSKGRVWIGTFVGGVCSYDINSQKITHHTSDPFKQHYLNTANVRIVYVDHKDNILVGTRKGLFKIQSKHNNSFEVDSFNEQIQDKEKPQKKTMSILSIYEDSRQKLWIGTDGYGLCAYDGVTKKTKWYDDTEDIRHTTIASLIESNEGDLWIGGNKGLTSFNPTTKNITNFHTKDGLLSNNFNFNSVYKDTDGSLFFGNYEGVNYFHPKKINFNSEVPKVFITGLKLFNKAVLPNKKNSPLKKVISATKTLTLKHSQSVFTFDFIGINFSHTEQNQYAYFLDGFEKEWNYVKSNTSATYTNIPPGDYTFYVKAANNDGIWNDSPTSLFVQIKAPWWKTYWAYSAFLIFIIIVGYFILRFVNERVEEKRIIINQREERKQIEVLNAKKIQFFTNISHEFRTPLTLILNPIEDILEDTTLQLSDVIKEKHNSIYKNTKRLSRLIDELMDFRKLQFGKMPLQPAKIDILAFATEIASYFEEEAAQRNIILSVENEDENNTIWADPSMLEKIIFNILSNAFKATPENGMVRLSIQRSDVPILLPLIDPKKEVPAIEININDTGSGIKKENIDKIFDRFFQAKEMDKQYYGGTGIGLEVVRSFMELHKGKIQVASKVNEGTKFTLYFAMGNDHFKDMALKKSDIEIVSSSVLQENTKSNNGINKTDDSNDSSVKKTILIVEDNAELRNYIKKELASNYKINTAENGKEGIEKANKTIPDLIITDVMMPIIDGYELCEKIKSDLKTSHIPLLMLTAKGMEVDRIKGIDAGADVYLKKPFNMKVLHSHIKQLITSRQVLFNKYFTGIQQKELPEQTTSLDKQFITKVLDYIQTNMSDPKLNVENLAEELLLSRSKLYRKIKALTGDTANEFLRKIRLEKAKQLIETSEDTISEICYRVGFSSPSYFTKCFKKHFGILPTEIRPEKNR
ncbi:MAG: response regulator, partial [Flavicella sp.]